MISMKFSTQRSFQLIPRGDFVVFWHYDFHTVFPTPELSTNSLGNFVVFWNYDCQTVFYNVQARFRQDGFRERLGGDGMKGGETGRGGTPPPRPLDVLTIPISIL
jgi:hypothetical protein